MVETTIDPSTPISTTPDRANEPTPNRTIGFCHCQYLLDNDQCALNYDNKRFSILAAARSSFHLNLLEAAYIKTWHPMLCRQKDLFILSNSFDNRGVLIWPLAALSLAFRYCKIFLWRALQHWRYHWLVLIA